MMGAARWGLFVLGVTASAVACVIAASACGGTLDHARAPAASPRIVNVPPASGDAGPSSPRCDTHGCPDGMVCVDGGEARLTFHRPENADEQRRLRVSAYCLDRTEVTVTAYDACARAGACEVAPVRAMWFTKDDDAIVDESRQCNGARVDRADHPINCVDFEQARRYCAWRGARVPSALEWVWAAQGGGAEHRYPWGDDEPGARICWSGAHARHGTCAVGQHRAGADGAGALDLDGNVSEWIDLASGVDPTSARAPASRALLGWAPPDGPHQGVAGFSWKTDGIQGNLTPYYDALTQERRAILGFRCARQL